MLAVILALVLQASMDSSVVHVTFRVQSEVPVTNDTVHIIGNHPVLGSWEHTHSLRLAHGSDGLWQGTVLLPRGLDVAFKITRGSWLSEAVASDGSIPPDTWISLSSDTTLSLSVNRWKDDGNRSTASITGTLHIHEDFPSSVLGTSRDIWVILPESYTNDETKRYPVLYVQDGQNVFDARLSYSNREWHLDETADSLAKAGVISDIIIVAVSSSSQRLYEYADTTLGELYARFIVEELKPFIDTTYRTMNDREHNAVMGSSMGALMSFLIVWWYPDVFGHAACLSPAFLWSDDKILHTVVSNPSPKPRPRIYLDVGDRDIERELQPATKRMSTLLTSKGWMIGTDLFCAIIKDAGHNEDAWAARMAQVLLFLFASSDQNVQFMEGKACE